MCDSFLKQLLCFLGLGNASAHLFILQSKFYLFADLLKNTPATYMSALEGGQQGWFGEFSEECAHVILKFIF